MTQRRVLSLLLPLLMTLFGLVACGVPTATSPDNGSTATATPPAPPDAVYIPALAASSDLIPLGLNKDKTLAVPDVHTPLQAGYWTGSGPPGDPGIPLIVVAHVNGDHKPGLFARLSTLKPGDLIQVALKDATQLTYEVYATEAAPKSAFPSGRVYDPTTEPELRAITCGGAFIGGALGYADNVVVFAKLIDNGDG